MTITEPDNDQASVEEADRPLLVSYVTLRRVVGVLGISLPFVLAVWGFQLCNCSSIQPSISDYYALRTRDAFVGVMFTVAWFLFAYRGYGRRDDIAGNLACMFALGVALFPNSGPGIDPIVHFCSAAALFLVLAYFSFSLFTKHGSRVTSRKLVRNRIYRFCGVSILFCIAAIGVYKFWLQNVRPRSFDPTFWLESFALVAFGLSWFVKGDTLFRDRSPQDAAAVPPFHRIARPRPNPS